MCSVSKQALAMHWDTHTASGLQTSILALP